jgi:chorismate dehydratase
MIRPLRLGIVPYLNVLPLLEGLEADFPRSLWTAATPRQLGELLHAGTIDVAAVSVFEGLRCADRYRLVPGCAIGSDGAVRSVALYSRKPLGEINTVLLDRASLSSSHLVQILARRLLSIRPVYALSERPLTIDFPWQESPHDAFLVIGDTALAWENAFPHALDLGDGWKRLTGLPFVFAAWWTRAGLELTADEAAAFLRARERGQRAGIQIADRVHDAGQEPCVRAMTRESLRHYLTEAIRYDLGPVQLESIDLFRVKLIEQGLLPPASPKAALATDPLVVT